MATKLQELLEELKGLKRFDIDPVDNGEFIEKEYRYEEEGMFIESSLLDQLIAKYTETTSDNESNTCDNCLFCYHCKNDDGRWVVCNNDKNKEYVKSIDRTFGCILFEPIN